jgi:hypothetical protein
LTERAHWLTVEWLPKYAPEMNDIEIVWGDRVTLRTPRASKSATSASETAPERSDRVVVVSWSGRSLAAMWWNATLS